MAKITTKKETYGGSKCEHCGKITGGFTTTHIACGGCGYLLGKAALNYCPKCGEKIEWTKS